MGHMKKSWGKTIKTILGVLVGNLVLSFAVAGKEVCIDNDHQFFYLSNIPVDGTVHSGNRQSDGE